MIHSSLLFVSLLAASAPAPRGQEHWEEVSDSDGVTVWTRHIPHSTLVEVKADLVIETTPDAVWRALTAVQTYPTFLSNVLYARVMRKVSQDEHIEYRRVSQPQVSYYDEVLDVTRQEDTTASTYYMHWKCMPGATGSVVRINACEGAWAIEPTPAGHAHVVYWNAVDPQGSIPSVVFNSAETNNLPGMLRQVARAAAAHNVAAAVY